MQKRKILTICMLTVIMAVFGAGLVKLFLLRFDVGDVYPPYSTLRSDPLGTRALYEGLEDMPVASVRRNFQPLMQASLGGRTTLFFLGADIAGTAVIPKLLARKLDRFIVAGGRMVVAFRPYTRDPGFSKAAAECAPPPNPSSDKTPEQASEETLSPKDDPAPSGAPLEKADPAVQKKSRTCKTAGNGMVTVADHWGLGFAFQKDPDTETESVPPPAAVVQIQADGLPAAVSWHTRLYFDALAQGWRTIYRQDGKPVLVERRLGRGTLVFAADSFLLSNEAMRRERHSGFLAWLVGMHPHIVFDETHHGILRQPGVMHLIRRYDLHWVIAGLLILATLFIWKQSMPLVPPTDAGGAAAAGDQPNHRDSLLGMTSLLQRHISSRDLLAACLSELEAVSQRKPDVTADMMQQMKDRLPAVSSDPVEGYRIFCNILKRTST